MGKSRYNFFLKKKAYFFSLINSLTESSLVKISPKPGTTRTINWFYVSSYCAIVDFPG